MTLARPMFPPRADHNPVPVTTGRPTFLAQPAPAASPVARRGFLRGLVVPAAPAVALASAAQPPAAATPPVKENRQLLCLGQQLEVIDGEFTAAIAADEAFSMTQTRPQHLMPAGPAVAAKQTLVNRRSVMSALSSAATLIAVASPSVASSSFPSESPDVRVPPIGRRSDQDLSALAARALDQGRVIVSMQERRAKIERIVERWRARNPKPAMREVKFPGNCSVEYERWFKRLAEAEEHEREAVKALDPNADLKLAMREYEAAKREWRRRKKQVERQVGLTEQEEAIQQAKETMAQLVNELCGMRPTTVEGLAAKAIVARELDSQDHAEDWSRDIRFQLAYFDVCIMAGDPFGDQKSDEEIAA